MNTLCIELNKGEFLDSKVVRLERGWRIHFVRGSGLYARAALLRICETGAEFSFPRAKSIDGLDSRTFREFQCDQFGAFEYVFFDCDESLSLPVGRGYFCVVPEWRIANETKLLTLSSLTMVTHLAKLLGPLSEWEDRLRVAKEAGYNIVHLTPVQKLGISNSSYSIAEYDQLNPVFEADFASLKQFVERMEHQWHMLTIQDVVWNHAAKNAQWLKEHPECAFNCANSAHLRPAYVVDRALQQFSREIARGQWADKGVPAILSTAAHLEALRHILSTHVFPSIRLHEFFQADDQKLVEAFKTATISELKSRRDVDAADVQLRQDTEYRRFGATVDLELAQQVFRKSSANESTSAFAAHLQKLNNETLHSVEGHISAAINAIMGHVHYERVAEHGPKLGEVSAKHPLVTNYFLHPPELEDQGWQADERLAFSPDSAQLMACNGWVMNADPLVNFAEPPSQVYLRRELVCWGDCVKLNYGSGPEHCPFLWDYMRQYTEECARMFHGFRIDNCHSTPIHVAEYLLKRARRIRGDLYVVAELFTGSEQLDNLFVNRLGITSLIREAQNAHNSHEQGRFVYRYGGDPVGAFHFKSTRPAPWAVAHALLYDQTHDNPSPVQKRTAYDFLPTAAMCSISDCASGTVRGYDEFVPHNIDVVKERRLYRKWSQFSAKGKGMLIARRLLNDLHVQLSESFTEVLRRKKGWWYFSIFVDQVNEDIVAVTRHNPSTHESVLLVAHTCFSAFKWTPSCRPIQIADEIAEILFELKTVEEPSQREEEPNEIAADESGIITGLPNFHVECYENVAFESSDAINIEGSAAIHFKLFPSGSVVALKINPRHGTKLACQRIEQSIAGEAIRNEARQLLRQLSLHDFNFLLFRCEPEERSESGNGAYDVPNMGRLVYCGLKGIQQMLQRIQESNDLGHPLCNNLRQGTWLIDYSIARMRRWPSLDGLAQLMQNAFSPLRGVPHFLRPCYFELVFTYFYAAIEEILLEKLFSTQRTARIQLTELLAVSSVSFMAQIPSAKLPPALGVDNEVLSLSAGLPHFAEGIWRNWGRDTFIALPGLLLLTGRHHDAQTTILAFAGTLRHGLIPNLLAEGKAPRYNCRDAVWFWLVAILRYVEMVEGGEKILNESVLRLYPTDEAECGGQSDKIEPLHATMHEALCRHFGGIAFRERNAGPGIDEHMRDEGFNVRAFIDKHTGLVFGGNRWNCGTWMDKMGSSERARNRGEPATPRDGAAVELQGMALRVAKALSRLSEAGAFPHKGMSDTSERWTWSEWAAKIEESFVAKFWVSADCEEKFANRRSIIKDSYGSSLGYTDFQLRPNFCIALDAVPDIVEPEKGWAALQTAGEVLAANAPLGICTLDPEDWAYNGVYNNDDDGTEKATAKGWNYHQGPEWLWIACHYMSAKLKVSQLLARRTGDRAAWLSAVDEVQAWMLRLERCMRHSDWASLPELTNAGGAPCAHSCPAQAWSVGCANDTVHTLATLLAATHQSRQTTE